MSGRKYPEFPSSVSISPEDLLLIFKDDVNQKVNFSVLKTNILNDSLITLGTENGLELVGTVLSLGLASATTTGALSSTDFNIFSAKEDAANKGQPNGYAQLDSGAKIPISLIPDSVLGQVEYEGTWDATTNTPTLLTTPDKKGEYYVVSTAGTFVGIDFQVGDWIISNGVEWEKVDNTDAVRTVFGRLGDVVANANDYNVFYVRHDTNAQGLNNTQKGNARTNINAEPTFAKNTGFNKNFGTVANTVTQGNDARLSDARVPLAHTHIIGDVTGLQTALNLKAPLESPTFTGTVSGITKSMVGLENVDNISDLNKPISTATQSALNNKKDNFAENTGFNKNFGTIAGTVAQGNDSRFHAALTVATPLNGLGLTGQELSLGFSSANSTGALSDTDFNIFSAKVGGSGTTNFLSKFTASGTIGNSAVFENGSNVGIGTTEPGAKLDVTTAAGSQLIIGFAGGADNFYDANNHFFRSSFGGSPRLTIASTGAATFSSSVTATSASIGFTSAAPTNGMIVQGTVGIGTTAPNAKLDVQGDAKINGVDIGRGGGNLQNNTRVGLSALLNNTTGNFNTANGVQALESNIEGSFNTANGYRALRNNTTGNFNTALGREAGRFLANNSTLTIANNSIFIGVNTKAAANNQTNQIVIGNDAIGAGDNSVVLGHTTITKTVLRGTINAANLPTSSAGLSAGDIFNDNGTLKIV